MKHLGATTYETPCTRSRTSNLNATAHTAPIIQGQAFLY